MLAHNIQPGNVLLLHTKRKTIYRMMLMPTKITITLNTDGLLITKNEMTSNLSLAIQENKLHAIHKMRIIKSGTLLSGLGK